MKPSQQTISINSECISSPTNNPRCIRQLSEIVRRYNAYRNQRVAPFEVSRKTGIGLQDEPEEKDDAVRRSIRNRSTKRFTINNHGMSIDSSLNQKLSLLKRLALQNKFEGNTVNTHQNIQEFNNRPRSVRSSWDSTRRSDSVDDALDQLTDALQRIIYTKDEESDEEQMAIVGQALQRVAVQNNIKGNTVKTNQDIKEYNEELVEAIDRALPTLYKKDRRQKFRLKYDLEKIAEELRRIAIKNDIKGNVLNTHQNVQEFNDEVVRTIVKAIKRMAIQNEIKGSEINTYQNVEEYNDALRRVAPKVSSRLAIGNQINGNVVNTKQNLAEINNDDPNNFDDDDEAAINLKKVNKPPQVSIKVSNKTHEFQIDPDFSKPEPKVKIEVIKKKAKNDKKIKPKTSDKSKLHNDEKEVTRRMGIHPYSRSNNMDLSAIQRIHNYLRGSGHHSSMYYPTDNAPWNYGQRSGLTGGMYSDEKDSDDGLEKDDETEQPENDELAEGEINIQVDKGKFRRLNSSINILNKKNEANDLVNNDEEEKSIHDELAEGEINAQTRRLMTVNNNMNTRRSDKKTKDGEELSSEPISKSLKHIECKTKDGRKISDADLRKFLDFLEKMKAAGRISDAMKTSK